MHYFPAMVKRCLCWSMVCLCALVSSVGMGDTIQLKDKGGVVGTVLAEKRDQVAVDIGYTVLVIPKNQIVKISRSAEPAPKSSVAIKPPIDPEPKADSTPAMENRPGFYSGSNKGLAIRTV